MLNEVSYTRQSYLENLDMASVCQKHVYSCSLPLTLPKEYKRHIIHNETLSIGKENVQTLAIEGGFKKLERCVGRLLVFMLACTLFEAYVHCS